MLDQYAFVDLEYQGKNRKTRRELFLERMDGLIPWQSLENRIRPFYPKAGRGRRPCPLPAMLRVHCVQLLYNLSDPGMQDLLYESARSAVCGIVALRPPARRDYHLEFPASSGKTQAGTGPFGGDQRPP